MESHQDKPNKMLDKDSSKDKNPKKENNAIGFFVLIVVILIAVFSGHEQRRQREQFQQTSPVVISVEKLQKQANTQFCEETQREKAIAGGYYDKDADYSVDCF